MESRKFVNKLRTGNKIIYERVFLKEFDEEDEKDMFNLAFLFNVLKKKLEEDYRSANKEKMVKIKDQGEAVSRDSLYRTTISKDN